MEQKKQSPVMRHMFINTVLEMLQEGKALRNLNLRQIAKRIGCAHTNAYNYFTSYEQLLWYAQGEALRRLIHLCGGDFDELNKRYVLIEERNIIEAFIKFALAHPSWYRLIWSEPIKGSCPPEVSSLAATPLEMMSDWLHRSSEEQSDHIRNGGILLSFIHGELSLITSGRKTGEMRLLVEQLFEDTNYIYGLLY
jgi:AcrR family transcriptional regulator